MAKARFRDVKQGRIGDNGKEKRRAKEKKGYSYPSMGRRVKAFITDSFMLLMPIMYIVFYLVMGGREGFAANKVLGWIDIIVPYLLISMAFIAKSGQTPGMRAYSMKVVDAKSKETPGLFRIFLRQLLGVLDFLFFGWIVGFFRKDHRTPHELIGSTAMVDTE